MQKNVWQAFPFLLLIGLILLVYFSNLHQYLSLDKLRYEQAALVHFVTTHPVSIHFIYIGFYILSVCLILPDSTILTLLGGYIFPLPVAIIYTLFAETIGALIFFLVFSKAISSHLLLKERPFLQKIRKGFHHHSASYLLFLRFSHILPFWLTNVGAAYFKVPIWTFIWTTVVGIIPFAVFLTEAGNSLTPLFEKHATLTTADIFTPAMKFALLGLGLLSLFPILYKNFKKGKK